jgi:hypothetical protein
MSYFEVFGSLFNFAGGTILAVDALRQQKRLRAQSGAERFLDIMKKHQLSEQLIDDDGKPLDTPTAFQRWFARHSQHLAWQGFVVMTAGFVLDLAGKCLGK